jgi:D-glycero-D-manno-heptose 1,7-bisphosphate phosphatase
MGIHCLPSCENHGDLGMRGKHKAIFLDRDGVLNHAIIKKGLPYSPTTINELQITDDAIDSLRKLKSAGFLLIGITNQPNVARGITSKQVVEAIHAQLMSHLPLDDIYVCYHDDKDLCLCRKPLPGLLTKAALRYRIDLDHSTMIGDRWKDIEAGQRAGCKTIWINRGYQESGPKQAPHFTARSLKESTKWILQGLSTSKRC